MKMKKVLTFISALGVSLSLGGSFAYGSEVPSFSAEALKKGKSLLKAKMEKVLQKKRALFKAKKKITGKYSDRDFTLTAKKMQSIKSKSSSSFQAFLQECVFDDFDGVYYCYDDSYFANEFYDLGFSDGLIEGEFVGFEDGVAFLEEEVDDAYWLGFFDGQEARCDGKTTYSSFDSTLDMRRVSVDGADWDVGTRLNYAGVNIYGESEYTMIIDWAVPIPNCD